MNIPKPTKKREAIRGELYGVETEDRKRELRGQLDILPTLKADVVKWPHNAHIFKNRELVEKLNAVIKPHCFVYQPRPAREEDLQDPVKFKAMIAGFGFKDKFINTTEYDVEIIS